MKDNFGVIHNCRKDHAKQALPKKTCVLKRQLKRMSLDKKGVHGDRKNKKEQNPF